MLYLDTHICTEIVNLVSSQTQDVHICMILSCMGMHVYIYVKYADINVYGT